MVRIPLPEDQGFFMSISTQQSGRPVSRVFTETRIDSREPNSSRISHLFGPQGSFLPEGADAEAGTDDLYRRVSIATAQRLFELGDQLRYGCNRQDCLAIRDAAFAALSLLEYYEGADDVLPLCRALSRPQDDWDAMIGQAGRLLGVIEKFALELRKPFDGV